MRNAKDLPDPIIQHIKALHDRNDKLQAKVDELVGQASKHEREKMEMREMIEAATRRAQNILGQQGAA